MVTRNSCFACHAGYYDTDTYREPLRILMGLVALVLLIACTNVAMMVQARNTVRRREFRLRLALGAGRTTIFRQSLCESLLLVTAGAALGWLFALTATRMLAMWSGIKTGLSPDRSVLVFTLLILMFTWVVHSPLSLIPSGINHGASAQVAPH